MNLRFTLRARADAEPVMTWWRRNRPAAPDAFEHELNSTLERIRRNPRLGILYEQGDVEAPVRRALMAKTTHHLYYTLDADDVVVLSIWGAQRGRVPTL